MLYILLAIIIFLLIKLIYQTRDKGAYFNKLFEPLDVDDFEIDDPRNETHPEEKVRLGFRYMTRVEAVEECEESMRIQKMLNDDFNEKV